MNFLYYQELNIKWRLIKQRGVVNSAPAVTMSAKHCDEFAEGRESRCEGR